MRYTKEQKEETKKRILDASNRSFKQGGYSGIGVDGLAKEAGVTSGAFYVHYKSKLEAFRASIVSSLIDVQDAIQHLRAEHKKNWWSVFSKFYMSERRTCSLDQSCGMQSLSPEVGRFDDDTKELYEKELSKIIEFASLELQNSNDKQKVWANVAMLVGGVTLARAVKDETISKEIALAIEENIINIDYK